MHTTLNYRDQRSNKVYRIAIEPQEGGYVVNFAYGRIGNTLSTGTKTTSPVPMDVAQKLYEQIIKQKMAKGYIPAADSVGYTAASRKETGIRPQLLNPIDAEKLAGLLKGSDYCLQPKYDGRRLLIKKAGATVTGINRRGIECGFPETICQAATALPGDFIIDGEAVGDLMFAFDILQWDRRDLRPLAYSKRLGVLFDLLVSAKQTAISPVPTQSHPELKTQLFEHLRKEQAEGVVFKKLTAGYCEGRPASGGDQLKYKFVETASVVVQAVNSKRSVAIAVIASGKLIPCGNVSIPADQPIPEPGNVLEVRYLYALEGSGSLYQPICLGIRDDIAASECTREQLKFRRQEVVA
jgi:bifunctional non-homologous end joining protein LigD